MREGWILDQIVVGEQDELAQLASDPVAGGLAVEEARQPRFRDVTHLVVTVDSVARGRDRVLVEISGKNLHERLVEPRGGMFRKEHGDRIRLLARGAARDPDPHLILGRLRFEQLRNKLLFELREGLGVPEEMCHADEQLFHQRERLVGLLPHPQRVARQGRHPDDGHPPVNPAKQRRRLVGREIVAGPDLEQHQDVAQRARVVEVIGRLARSISPNRARYAPILAGISCTGSTTSTRPVAMAWPGISLYSAWLGSCAIAKPPCSLMRLRPAEPLVPVPGQNHADRPRTVRLGKRTKKDVHWRSTLFRASEFGDGHLPVEDCQASVRRDDVDVIRLREEPSP